MTTKMNLEGTNRKALVATIAEITGEKPIYRNMPTSNYDIGDITVTRDGCIICPDDSSILAALAEKGFTPEAAEDTKKEPTGLTINLPMEGFTDSAIDNLKKLVEAKDSLIRKALSADRLDIMIEDGKVTFPWWNRLPKSEETQAYTGFLAALCRMAREVKCVLAKETEVESEKYAFRCFLLRLGYIGEETKADRKILLRNLSGHSAFHNQAEADKFIANQKARNEQPAAEMSEEAAVCE